MLGDKITFLMLMEFEAFHIILVISTVAAARSLQSCPTCATPYMAAHQAPLSTGLSRQEYWSGLPFLSPLVIFTVEQTLSFTFILFMHTQIHLGKKITYTSRIIYYL